MEIKKINEIDTKLRKVPSISFSLNEIASSILVECTREQWNDRDGPAKINCQRNCRLFIVANETENSKSLNVCDVRNGIIILRPFNSIRTEQNVIFMDGTIVVAVVVVVD